MLEEYLQVVDKKHLKEVVEDVIHQYRTSVIPKRSSFRSCEYIYVVCSHILSPLYLFTSSIQFVFPPTVPDCVIPLTA